MGCSPGRVEDPAHRLRLERPAELSRLEERTRLRGRQALRVGGPLSHGEVLREACKGARTLRRQASVRTQQHPRRQLRGWFAELDGRLRADVRDGARLFAQALPAAALGWLRRHKVNFQLLKKH